jgi:peptidoglycan/LPS O-acetylase OafA/YrhL
VARIYPLYFLVTSLTFLLVWVDPRYDIWDHWRGYTAADQVRAVVLNYALLRGYFPNFLWTGIIPGWTLTVEETFYVLAPVLLLGLARTSRPLLLLVLYAAGLVGTGLLLVKLLPAKTGLLLTYKFMLNYTFFGRCIEFFVGVALALFLRRKPRPRSSGWVTWLGLGWVGACVVGLALAHAPLPAGLGTGSRLALALLLPVGTALLFYGLIHEQTWLRRLLATRLFDLLGKSSYAFYLIHMGVVTVLLNQYVSRNLGVQFGLLVGLSILLFLGVEDPLRKQLRNTVGASCLRPQALGKRVGNQHRR